MTTTTAPAALTVASVNNAAAHDVQQRRVLVIDPTDPRGRFTHNGEARRIVNVRIERDGEVSIDTVALTKRGTDKVRGAVWVWLTLEGSLRRFEPEVADLVEATVAADLAQLAARAEATTAESMAAAATNAPEAQPLAVPPAAPLPTLTGRRPIRRAGTLAVYNHHGADVVVRIESYRDVNDFGDVAYTVSTTPSGYVLPAPIAADRLADPDADQVRRAAAVLRPARDARRGDEVLGPDGWVVIDGTEPRREWPFSHLRFITRTPRDFHRPADAEVWIVRTP